MEIRQYLDLIKSIEEQILDYISDENSTKEQLEFIFDFKSIDQMSMDEILNLIVKITNNYHRTSLFPDKITSIILHLKEYILQNYTNFEIFNIFKDSSFLLLILMNEKMLTPTKSMFIILSKNKYEEENYFFYLNQEFKTFLTPKLKKKMFKTLSPFIKEDESQYNHYRKIGENHSYLSSLIRNDSIEEFIIHTNKTNMPLNSKLASSIFETNKFLINKEPTLIEYAAFFGSLQIMKYLVLNGVELTSSLWFYSIHGNNPEMIHYIEENDVLPTQKSYKNCIHEALKCHHYDIANYLLNLFVKLQYVEEFKYNDKLLKYSCYLQFDDEFIDNSLPFRLFEIIRYNYTKLFDIFLKLKKIDINSVAVLFQYFYSITN